MFGAHDFRVPAGEHAARENPQNADTARSACVWWWWLVGRAATTTTDPSAIPECLLGTSRLQEDTLGHGCLTRLAARIICRSRCLSPEKRSAVYAGVWRERQTPARFARGARAVIRRLGLASDRSGIPYPSPSDLYTPKARRAGAARPRPLPGV